MRSLRNRAIIFGYPLLEVLVAWAIATWIGWGPMLLLLIIGVPIGFAIMKRSGRAAAQDLAAQRQPSVAHASGFLGGFFITIPGFISDIVGVSLLVPFTRRLIFAALGPALSAKVMNVRMPRSDSPGFGDVIVGEVVVDQGQPKPPPSELNPPQEDPRKRN